MNPSNNNQRFDKRLIFFYADLITVLLFFLLSSYPDLVSSNDDYSYPVRTTLEIKTGAVEYSGGGESFSEFFNKRFRRLADGGNANNGDDATTEEQQGESSSSSSSRDYMSTYYAQRKAIMDKYNSQQRAINERLERTKSLIAAKKRLRESNTRLDGEKENFTRPAEIIPPSNGIQLPVDEVVSTTTTTTTESVSSNPESSTEEVILPEFEATTFPPVSFENNNEVGNEIESEEDELNNVSAKNESISYNRESPNDENGTLVIDLGGRLTDHPWRNDSASAELDRMFLWDVETEEGRLDRSNGTSEFRDYSSPGISVRIENSPGIKLTKNLTNVQSSRTMYRNSSHEIREIDGVVTDVKKIHHIVGPEMNSTGNEKNGTSQFYGGARESEWCEECPHDYRWGYCNGSLFYQHNIFLRNRGPSAIDAVFGMEVQGPVDVTCVEALRFNQTRGIVSLHDGGPGHDFVKLRIRGFEGEGFSYIMKVWGVNSEAYNSSSTPAP